MDRNGRDGLQSLSKLTATLSLILNALRRSSLYGYFYHPFRIFRQLIHFGPWKVVPKFVISRLSPASVVPLGCNKSLLGALDVNDTVVSLRQNSLVIVGELPKQFVTRLRKVTDKLPVNDYQIMHHIDEDVRLLTNDPTIKNVLRAYFKSEPVLLESTLVITGQHKTLSEQNAFHFDYAGWESMNVFVYLSDVTVASSCHIVVKGSHRNIRLLDVLRGSITEDEAQRRFGPAIQSITGPAGTIFFENTEAFHRRHPGNERRVMLNLLYASHRSLLSHGRTSRNHISSRKKVYDRVKAET